MGRPLCGVMSAEGKLFTAFVKDEKQAEEFAKLLFAPEPVIKDYCMENGIACEENRSCNSGKENPGK